MNFRNSYLTSLSSTQKNKPAQSQSPLQKKKYYKFVNESSNQQGEYSMQDQRLTERFAKEPPKEKKEEFKREIERRFERSTVNPGYKFPRYSSESYSEQLSDSSIESLQRLNGSIKYDLHCQNLRYFAKTQGQFLNEEYGKHSSTDGAKRTKTKQISQNLIPVALTAKQSEISSSITIHGIENELSSDILRRKIADKMKADMYSEQSNGSSEMTPATNDTAFSTFNKATSNVFSPSAKAANSGDINLSNGRVNIQSAVQQLAPMYRPKTNKAQASVYHSRPTALSTRELVMPQHPSSARNIYLVHSRQPIGTVGSSKRSTQNGFFSSKNQPNTTSSNSKTTLKTTATTGMRSAKQANNNYGCLNNADLSNTSSEKSQGSTKISELERFLSFKGRNSGANIKSTQVYQKESTAKSTSREQSGEQLRNTSCLYTKMQNDLLKNMKLNDFEDSQFINLPASKIYQGSVTSKTSVAKQPGIVSAKALSTKQFTSPRTQNLVMVSTPHLNTKKTEIKVPKLEICSSRPAKHQLKQHSDIEHSLYMSTGLTHLQKLMERSGNSNFYVRTSYSREGGVERSLDSNGIKFDLKNLSQKNGAMTDRPTKVSKNLCTQKLNEWG